jgi:hypothetical protein
MHDPHKNPGHIFTTYLDLSHIFFSQHSSEVTLLGCYGDLLDLDMKSISIETDFTALNDLLAEAGFEAEYAIEQIATLLSQPNSGDSVIDLCDEGGIHLSNHIFALMMIAETDEEGNVEESEEYSYRLVAVTPRENLIPDFIDLDFPVTDQERSTYFNLLLALRYRVYLTCIEIRDENTALFYSNLTDPLFFNLARTAYELPITGQTD